MDAGRDLPWWDRGPSRGFVQRLLLTVGVLALVYLLWQVRNAFLLAFAGVVVATVLVAASEPVQRLSGLSRRWSVVIAAVAILVLIAAFGALVGTRVASQASGLINQLPTAVASIEQQLGLSLPSPQDLQRGLERQDQEGARGAGGFPFSSRLLSWLASWGAALFEILTSLILVVITGVFLSTDPDTYRNGLVQLFPPRQHQRVDHALVVCGRSLRLWLKGQLISMTLVGVLAGLGTWLIGLPGPLALGLFAGLTEFIPIIGPIIGAVPAVLFAATQGWTTLLWTVLLYLAIQQLESNMITPIVERRVVSLPPALLLVSAVAFSLMFGVLGLVLAAPLTVVTYVAVKQLYVRDTLGEPTPVPGEDRGG